MIIAPFSTPIMGIAPGAVQRRRSTAVAFVALGGLLVLLIGAAVTGVGAQSRTFYVHVRSPGGLPPIEDLLADLEGQVPDGLPIVVDATRGQQIIAGKVGEQPGPGLSPVPCRTQGGPEAPKTVPRDDRRRERIWQTLSPWVNRA
ncbi:hypothetical protein OG373_27345 [Streptomyces avidinii]|uniref:hypothetical protein n=1 Tax=Streptomyces avidinii TaxID=1895 RepID=UPI003864AA43|nr:hypothetical protein OG373_27345 [Streptomyces avidinii]